MGPCNLPFKIHKLRALTWLWHSRPIGVYLFSYMPPGRFVKGESLDHPAAFPGFLSLGILENGLYALVGMRLWAPVLLPCLVVCQCVSAPSRIGSTKACLSFVEDTHFVLFKGKATETQPIPYS